jgi:hypothetical protein
MRGAIPPLPQYAFMAWCLVKHKDNFTFYLYSGLLRRPASKLQVSYHVDTCHPGSERPLIVDGGDVQIWKIVANI